MLFLAMLTGMMLSAFMYSVYVLAVACIVWMVVDAAKQDRFWWVVIIIGVPVIGAAVYFFTEKKHEYAKVPSHHVHDSETESQHETTPHHRSHES